MTVFKGVVLLLGIGIAFAASAHDGALDSYGCHPNIAHGTYHCHLGPLAGLQFRTRADMVRAYQDRVNRARPKPKLMPSRY